MKKILFFSVIILALVSASCKNGGKDSKSVQKDSAPSVPSAVVSDSDTVKAATPEMPAQQPSQANAPAVTSAKVPVAPVPGLEKTKTPTLAPPQKPAEKPKVPVKPESDTDKLIKQYSVAMLSLIEASKTGGDAEETATQQFIELQGQLDKLEKSGQLSDTQKELFKVTTDAYNRMKSK